MNITSAEYDAIQKRSNPPVVRKQRGTGRVGKAKAVAIEELCREPIILTLPYPPSSNHLYTTWRGRRALSREGRAYKNAVKNIAARAGCKPFLGKVQTQLFLGRQFRHIDLGNTKVLYDALEGYAYINDRQRKRITEDQVDTTSGEDFALIRIEAFRQVVSPATQEATR